jgi:hypothetical protein
VADIIHLCQVLQHLSSAALQEDLQQVNSRQGVAMKNVSYVSDPGDLMVLGSSCWRPQSCCVKGTHLSATGGVRDE